MRLTALILVLMTAACGDWPDLPESATSRASDWPTLMPFDELIGTPSNRAGSAPEDADGLARRAAALQARAALMRVRISDQADFARLRARLAR